ncbi:MAG: NAD(P)/FAD-dependent oxidoreductase [Salipiger thiooxidans]
MRVIVIGAGVLGASTAYCLAEAGAEVTVVDPDRPGGGTSAVTYAWVNACEKIDRKDYFDLNMAGRAAHAEMARRFPRGDWYHRPGLLQWRGAEAEAGPGGSDPVDKHNTLVDWGYPSRLVSETEVHALEPDINPTLIAGTQVVHYPEDGWLDPVPYCGTLIATAAEQRGTRLVAGRVSALIAKSDSCQGVMLDNGASLTADVVVNCAGRWLNEVTLEAGLHVPLAPTYGIVAYTMPTGLRLRSGIRTPLINLRPDGGGRLLLRSNELDRQLTAEDRPSVDHPLAQELLARAVRTLPALAGTPIEAVRIATRPIPADSFSCIGPMPALKNYFVGVTHSGVTIGPFAGQALTAEILTGAVSPLLSGFRPARFFECA